MIYLWIALGLLLLLVVVPIVVGSFMPERYTGTAKIVYAKPRAEVWQALLDPEKHPMTGKMMKAVERRPDGNGLPSWIEVMASNERISVNTMEQVEAERIVREMDSTALPMSSRWVYALQDEGEGCCVTIDAETTIRKGPILAAIFRFMMVVGGGVKAGLKIQLGMVAATLGVPADFRS